MDNALINLSACRTTATLAIELNMRTALTIGLAFFLSAPVCADLNPYAASYSIYRNGKVAGRVDIQLSQQDDQWTIRSEGGGTHGLARILRAKDIEYTTGTLEQGRFQPLEYSRHTRVAAIDDRWLSTFDWPADEVVVVHDNKETFRLALQGEALDPLSMKLEMRRRLLQPNPDLNFLMVEEDEVEPQTFRTLESEWLETSLGCLQTIPIEKVRKTQTRYTRAWHAPAFGNIEVRVEHGKVGGNHMEMRINELEYKGAKVAVQPGCAARQAGQQGG